VPFVPIAERDARSRAIPDRVSGGKSVPKISPFLWFDGQAEEAMNLYVSIFPNSEILNVARAGDSEPASSVTCRIGGLEIMGFNAGPQFKFNEAISFFVNCADQAEVDYYWDKLLADGGEPSRCGWLKDRFGLSWQIIPDAMSEMLGDSDREKAGRAMQSMFTMAKIDIAAMRKAFDGS
jgi:predicted 3-demethylubiquinone-9 3-methyltransferase (glyoxalase superfamily)